MKDRALARPLRLGVVGFGRVVERYHLGAIRGSPGLELSGVCDQLEERRARLRSLAPGVPTHASLPECLARCELDAILIATPPANHAEPALLALGRGLHVLVEKPVALGLDDAQAMYDAAVRSGAQLRVGFNRRFWRPYRDLKEWVSARNGRIRTIRLRFLTDARSWTPRDPLRYGGVLEDLASHQLDLLGWLLGLAIERVRVTSHHRDAQGLEAVRYEVELKGGLIACCEAGQTMAYRESVEIGLDHGVLVATPRGAWRAPKLPAGWIDGIDRLRSLPRSVLRKVRRQPNEIGASFARQWDAFLAAVQQGHSTSADATDGLRNLQAIEALRQSLESDGAWVTAPEFESKESDAAKVSSHHDRA